MEKPRIQLGIVNLYGCDLNSPLKMYLDEKVAVTIWEENISHIMLCGGPSQQKSFPGETEANVAFNHLQSVLPPFCTYYLEDQSLNTFRNVKHAARIYLEDIEPIYDVYRIWYFCETQRSTRTEMLVKRFFPDFRPGKRGRDLKFETISWEQRNPDLELLAIIKDMLAYHIPPLERYYHNQLSKRAKNL